MHLEHTLETRDKLNLFLYDKVGWGTVLEKNGWKNRLQLSLEESSMEMVFYSLSMPTLSIH